MTVSSTQSYIEYNGDGATTTFQLPFYFIQNSDISALVASPEGAFSEPVNGQNFTVTGGGTEGGTATFSFAYPSGFKILLYRNPPVTQETKYYENGKFPATSHEAALDKLTMLIQEMGWRFDGLSLKRPSIFSDYYDAKNRRVSNLQDPVDGQDAATKSYADAIGTGNKSYVDQLIATESSQRAAADDLLQAGLTSEQDARADADAQLLKLISSSQPLPASPFSPISWHDQVISTSVTIPANKNAWSFGPTMTIASGQQVTIGDNSYWTIANGEVNE